ncbi:MAG TPA: carboxylating nicotinate-nucleotide diphosphorylase [Cyclobacteriaceae bacterium]|nr:carboxylating nicotinate-nucleotide diphosphorylase [Cyclobacteriaceae bacterium]
MIPAYLSEEELQLIITRAIEEDLGDGDHTTLAVIPEDQMADALMICKSAGIIAGTELAVRIFRRFDRNMAAEILIADGNPVSQGDKICKLRGNARAILTAERIAVNFMQRMSGIATATRHLSNLLEGTGAHLLDTRKTTPLIRKIEKWAVQVGGGNNHRIGLYDMIMLKDNHIDFAGNVTNAIRMAKQYLVQAGKNLKIEVETRSLHEVREVLEAGGVDFIMLDNMSLEDMKKAVGMIDRKIKTEASGNINEHNIRDVALCGVDYISVGAITHSVKSMDISLKAEI